MKLADQIREHVIEAHIKPARRRHEPLVEVVAGDIHREMKLRQKMPAVCSALRTDAFLAENGLRLERQQGPESMQSSTVKYTYRLMDNSEPPQRKSLMDLYGIGKDLFASLGGGEAFLRKERENFYGDRKDS